MVEEMWNLSLDTWLAYWGDGWHSFVFFLCLVYLLISKRERKDWRIFVGYTLAALVVFFLPYTADFIANYCIGKNVYWRVLWLLPVAPVIAYVCTRVCTRWKNAGAQMILAAVFLVVLVFTGTQVYVNGNYEMPDNAEKIPYEVKAVAEMVRKDAKDGKKRLAAPEAIATYIRIYAPDIRMPYGRGSRGTSKEKTKLLYLMVNQEQQWVEPSEVTKLAQQSRCNYLVLWIEDAAVEQEYERYGCVLVGMVDKYHIYKCASQ